MYIKYLPTGPSYSVGMLENGKKYSVLRTYSKKKEKRKKTQERKYLHQLAVHFCLACMNKSISAI
jgi:hypothetical protein